MRTVYTAPPHATGKKIYSDGLLEVARDRYPEFLTEAQKEADAKKRQRSNKRKMGLTDRQELLKRMDRDGWNTTVEKKKDSRLVGGYHMRTFYTAPPHATGKKLYSAGLLEVARDRYPEFLTEAQKEADAKKRQRSNATLPKLPKKRKSASQTGTARGELAPTHLTLHSGAAARDLDTGKVCRVVEKVWGGGAWKVQFPGDDELVERPADKLEAIEA